MAEATITAVEQTAPAPAATGSPGLHDGAPKPLTRSIGVVGGTLLTLSCLTPASSLFVIVPGLFATQGTGTALTMVIAGILCIGVAFCYSELGTMVPSAGGEYAMVGSVIGRLRARLGGFMAWLVFIVALIVVMVVPPIIAIGTAEYIGSIAHIDPKIAGASVMLLSTVMGLLDLRANAWVTGIFLVLEVIAAGLVAFLGFTHTHQSASSLIHTHVYDANGIASPMTMGIMLSGLAVALFALQGFSTAVYLAEEMENPRRTVSRTVLWTLGIGSAVLIIPTIAITLGAPDMKTLASGDLVGMIDGWSNSGVGTFISLCIALAIINAAIVMVIQNSRVLYASARDRAWPNPINKAFGTVNRLGSPWVATLVVGVPGAVLCFVNLDMLNQVTSVAVAALYLIVAIAALFTRSGGHKATKAWRMPLWPVVPVVIIATLVYVLTQQSHTSLYITGGIIGVAAAYWFFYLRPRPHDRWVITLPDEGTPADAA